MCFFFFCHAAASGEQQRCYCDYKCFAHSITSNTEHTTTARQYPDLSGKFYTSDCLNSVCILFVSFDTVEVMIRGLKTASLSQCKALTVISKQGEALEGRKWDLESVYKSGEWSLIVLDDSDVKQIPQYKQLEGLQHGTIVIWENLIECWRALFLLKSL